MTDRDEGRTFTMPEHGIMCFHCGEVFMTYGSARDHFGATEGARAGCLIDQVAVEEGGRPERGRGLLMALRKAEEERDALILQIERLEAIAESHAVMRAQFKDSFGTTSVWTIKDRLSNAEFRANHAVSRLDAAGVSFEEGG